ncbi:hypothetical protein HV341_10615 [Citrobacter sp. RHBSTW-00976]|uniref:hypothetical protein n=1 Tax=Citrobacter sp. RHBSTW-00976 TaxID=2742674 RepID=UPI0015E92EA8|nr:hypothetical protein [Citrobacter sp. RHBSTW-00976]QLR62489.1 hypothetical protein HV341_10615 [Citrobacter sp. RHBSTW-00976]
MPDSISKEQWETIRAELQSSFCCVRFRYQDTVITVTRERQSESRTCLMVYFDGRFNLGWGDSRCASYNPLTEHFWFTKTRRLHSARHVAETEKALGKRYTKKHMPSLYQPFSYRTPLFASSTTLIRQFRKVPGLTLVTEEKEVLHG